MSKFPVRQVNCSEIVIRPYKLFNGAILPDWLMEWGDVPIGAKLVYAKLCQCAGRTGKAFPSQGWLAQKLAMSLRSVASHIAKLCEFKLIKIESRGYGKACAYLFLWHERMKVVPSADQIERGEHVGQNGQPEHNGSEKAFPCPIPATKEASRVKSEINESPAHTCAEIAQGYANPAYPYANLAYRKELLKEKRKLSSLEGDSGIPNADPSPPSSQPASFFSDSRKEESPLAGVQAPDLNIPLRWPLMAATGFGQSQVQQLCRSLTVSQQITVSDLAERLIESFFHIEARLEQGPLMDAQGNLVGNPRGFLYRALETDGFFSPPPGWLSPEQLEARKMEEKLQEESRLREDEIRREKTLQREKENAGYLAWRKNLSDDELMVLKGQMEKEIQTGKGILRNFELWLRVVHWNKNIKHSRECAHV